MARHGEVVDDHRWPRTLAVWTFAAFVAVLLPLASPVGSASAATITVNTTDDEFGSGGGCSLREAIRATNQNADFDNCVGTGLPYGNDTIMVPAGGYTLSLVGAGEDATATGDLDILDNLTITGAGASTTTVNADDIDRVFHIVGSRTVLISGVIIHSGVVTGNGGGILQDDGSLSLIEVWLVDNLADVGHGGGLFSGGTFTIVRSFFQTNNADLNGGAIYVTAGTNQITNSTFDLNVATGFGGGIYSNAGETLISHTTFRSNEASGNGGAIFADGTMGIRAVILANSTNSNCVFDGGSVDSFGSNLSDDGSCPGTFNQPGDQTGVSNLNLAPGNPTFNGGPTPNIALLAGSAAIDAVVGDCTDDGDPAGNPIMVDQRNVSRPIDGNGDGNQVCDVGAYEAPARGSLRFSSATYSVNENGVSATITVQRANGSVGPIDGTVTPSNNTAAAPADYVAAAQNVSFADGDTADKTVGITINDDTLDEANETVNLTLTSTNGAVSSPSTAILTIIDDDASPTISIGDATAVTEGDAGSVTASFPVSLSVASAQTVTVQAQTADGTATAGSDYTATTQTVTFTPGTTTQTLTVQVLGDAINEANETFAVNLSGASNATIADGQGLGTITDDDVLTVSIDDQSVTEGSSGSVVMVFNVSLSRASGQAVTVQAQTADNGSATAAADYTATGPTTLTFAPGTTTQTFSVPVVGDTLDEANETFVVNLTNLNLTTNASIADAQGIGTINDDDGAPALSIADRTLDEGNSGTTRFVFTVSLLPASAQTVTVQVQTADGTATVADGDYTATGPTTLTFAPGTTTQSFTVPVRGDTKPEGNETFAVNLSGATSASVIDDQATGTIRNDDRASLTIADVSLAEGSAGTTPFGFTVTLSSASTQTVTVQAQTANGSAIGGDDYTPTGPTTLTFAPGATSQTFTVPVRGDTVNEPDERFFVNLSAASNAEIDDAQAIGTIQNDDGQVTLAIDDVTLPEGNSGTTGFRFTVTLPSAASVPVSVQVQTADGTARADSDYAALASQTVTFTPGTTAQTVTVLVSGDTEAETDETFSVRLSGAVNAAISDGEGLGTIRNDDGDLTVSQTQPQDTANNNGPGPKKEKEDGEGKPTEEQQQQQQLTNASNRDDVSIEGNVVAVFADEQPPYVVIANRDGLVKVVLYKDAAKVAGSIRVGDYLEADGEKQHEQLFDAYDLSIKR